MAQAIATFRLTRHDTHERVMMGPGEFIGRSDVAAMCLDDPRISEAHAMVSLRDDGLKLLALRGRFRIDGKVTMSTTLKPGLLIELAQGVDILCESVTTPDALLGVSVPGLPNLILTGTMTLDVQGVPSFKRGFDAQGDAVFWSVGTQWRVSLQGGPAQVLETGAQITCRGVVCTIISVPLDQAKLARTHNNLGTPSVFCCMNEVVRIQRVTMPVVVVGGIPGKILASLLRHGGAVRWQDVIDDVWPGDLSSLSVLRRRFDAGLGRLREQCRQTLTQGEDFITLDGAGTLTVHLGEHDRVEHHHVQ